MAALNVWSDITDLHGDGASTVEALFHQPVDVVVGRPDQLRELHVPSRVHRAWDVDGEDLEALRGEAETVVVDSPGKARAARRHGFRVGLRAHVHDGDSLEACRAAGEDADFLIVHLADPTNIPLELLIAETQGTPTQVIREVTSSDEALVAMGVLETGPDGVMFPVTRLEEISELGRYLAEAGKTRLELVQATVTSARSLGIGYRSCIDTVSLFEKDEGMIVGSTSSGGFLVCAEVHYLPYMNLRPFRVNAGAVHSYAWGPRLTEYLTDLRTGSTLLAVNTRGDARPVTVGRMKTEVRSLRLIEAEADGVPLNLFLQDDWHVRVFGGDGEPRNCTEVRPGDTLLAHVCAPGRHVGIKVDETIQER